MAQNSNDIVHVYLLHIHKDGIRPTAIPFSSLLNLKKQVIIICMKNDRLESRFRNTIELFMANGDFDRAVETFRTAQIGNNRPLGFDMWWNEEPQVLL